MGASGSTTRRQDISDKELRDIAARLGPEWEELATRLGFEREDIFKFKSDNPHDTNNQIFAMLVRWRQKQPRRTDKTDAFCKALKQVGRGDLAEQLREISGDASTEDLKYCQQQVIEFYKTTTSKIQAHPAVSSRTVDTDEFFLPLELALKGERISRERVKSFGKEIVFDKEETAIHLATWEDLFNQNVVKKLNILLSGVAGCGKSTLLMRVANSWTKPGQLVKFKCVFLLELKKMKTSSCIVDAIFEQILPQNTRLKRSGLIQVINDYEADIAILLDGLDEISFDILNSAEGVFRVQDILRNRVLVKSCVLVTSRPHRIDYILSCHSNYAHVQTLGFTNESISKYVKKYFAKNVRLGDALIVHLISNNTLLKLAGIPLITLMLCILWETQEELPAKLTELYSQFAMVLYYRRYGESQDQQQKVAFLLSGLGRIALDGVIEPAEERLIFEKEEFGSCASLLEKGCQTGILQQESQTSGLEKKNVVTFLHKSFQEYAAAIYLAKLLENDDDSSFLQLKHITAKNIYDKEHLLRFCCGISSKAAGHILDHVRGLTLEFADRTRAQKLARLLFFESGSKDLVSKLDVPIQVVCENREDLRVLSYYVECLPQPLVGMHLEVECESHDDLVLLREVLLGQNMRLTSLLVWHTVSKQGTKELQHLKETLRLMDGRLRCRLTLRIDIDKESLFDAECVSGYISEMSPQLEELNLVIRGRSHRDVSSIVCALKEIRLCCIGLQNTNMRGHVTDLAPLVTPSLKEFTLNTCGLVDDDITDLISILPAGHGLERLCLNGNSFSVDAVKTLTDHLWGFSELTTLSLNNIGLEEDVVKRLVWQILPVIECSSYADLTLLRGVLLSGKIALTRLKQVTYIMSAQGTKEMQHLEETLELTNKRLRGRLTLGIDIDEKSSFDAKHVSDCISRMSPQVEEFNLVIKSRSHRDVSSIVSALKECRLYGLSVLHTNMHGHLADLAPLAASFLKRLQLPKCGLVDDDITDLISILPAGHALKRLFLDGNRFSVNAVKTLTHHLRCLTELTTLSLENIGLDEDVVKRLVWQILPVIECSSYADLSLLRDVLLSDKTTLTRLKQVAYTMSTQGTKEMQRLEETLTLMDERVRCRLTLRTDIDEDSSFDTECVSDCISRMSHQVEKFILVIRRRSHRDVSSIVSALKECRLYDFSVVNTNMCDHVADLTPLVTSSLKHLELTTCGLVDDDITDLIRILPTGHALERLFLDGNSFSVVAVKTLTNHLRGFKELATLSLDNIGLDEDVVKQQVWQILPEIQCSSYADLMLLRDVLLSGKMTSNRLELITYTVSTQGTNEIQHLEETLGLMDERLRSQLTLMIVIDEKSSFDAECVLDCISRTSHQVDQFDLVIRGRSHCNVSSILCALKESSNFFGLHETNMRGHVTVLAPLITPSLKDLTLITCGLVDDDIIDLIGILPIGHGLERLCLDGNSFSADAVKTLTDHLREFPKLTSLSLNNIGLDEDVVKRLVWQILPVIECSSYTDLTLLRDVLLSGKMISNRLKVVAYTVSTQGTKEMQHLEETLRVIDERLRCRLTLRIHIDEKSSLDAECVSDCISRISHHVEKFTLGVSSRSHCDDVSSIVCALKERRLYGFGLRNTNMRGHVTDLAPLVTPSFKELMLNTCGLVDDDITDLISILPTGQALERLFLDGNAFSLVAVMSLIDHLRGFSKLISLSLDDIGLDEDLVKSLVWQTLPVILCSSYTDLRVLRDVCLSGNLTSTRLKQVTYTMSTHGTKKMQHLEETLGLMDERLRCQLTLRIDIDEKASFDMECVSDCISRMSQQVEKFIVVISRRPYCDVISIACALKGSNLYCFGLHNTNMNGHVIQLASLVTPSLKEFRLSACGLVDDDITDLISVLATGQALERLYLDGNKFSVDAIKVLTDHLSGLPDLFALSLDVGLDEDVVKRLVWQALSAAKCTSYADVTLLRNIFLSDKMTSIPFKQVTYTISAQGTKEMQHLEETLGLIDERLRGRLTLMIDINEKSSFDAEFVSECISRMSHQMEEFHLVIKGQSQGDVSSIVSALKKGRLHKFALVNTNMHGHVTDFAPLLTSSLKTLALHACGLVDDDLAVLIRMLPAGHGLEGLFLDGNSFSLAAVKALTDYLRSFHLLTTLSLDNIGLDENIVKQLVWQVLSVTCTSYTDLTLLRNVLFDSKMKSSRLKNVTYTMSTQGTKEIQHLEETLGRTGKRLLGELTLWIRIDEKSSFDTKLVSDCISRMSHQLQEFILAIKGRSHRDVSSIVYALKGSSRLHYFALLNTNMHGHVADFAPLLTSYLKGLALDACGLVDDDLAVLIRVLPTGHGLEGLFLDGNSFSMAAVKALTDHLRSFPKLTTLSLDNIGLDEDVVKRLVWQILSVIECRSHADLTLLRDVLLSDKMKSIRLKQVTYTMSPQGTKEMQHLEETLGLMDERLRSQLTLRIDIDRESSFGVECVSESIFGMSHRVQEFSLAIKGRSHHDVSSIVCALKGSSRLHYFALLNTNMHGHVADFAPLLTSSLKVLALDTCGLVDDDIADLISILPSGHGLERLVLDGNAFSVVAVKTLTDHLREFPKLTVLSLDNIGIDEDNVKRLIQQFRLLKAFHLARRRDNFVRCSLRGNIT